MADTEALYCNTMSIKNTDDHNCSVCKKRIQEPKLLPCFHTFCKIPCLERLVAQGPNGQFLTCPTCKRNVSLPANGVAGLLTNFPIERGLKGQHTLKKGKVPDCENCKKMKAYKYCQQCKKFMCKKCIETHQMWGDFSNHDLLDTNTMKNALNKNAYSLKCNDHPDSEAELYCDTCAELICSKCTVMAHRGHNYSLRTSVFSRHKEELISRLRLLKANLGKVQQAVGQLDTTYKEVNNQRAIIESDINREFEKLHQLLDQRQIELLERLDSYTQQKLQQIEMHRNQVKETYAKMSTCLDYAETGVEVGNEGEVLRLKALVLNRIDEITREFDSRTVKVTAKADIRWIPNNQASQACKEYGNVVCESLDNEMIYDSADFDVSLNTSYEIIGKSSINKQDNIDRDLDTNSQCRAYQVVPIKELGIVSERPADNKFVVAANAFPIPVVSKATVKRNESVRETPIEDTSRPIPPPKPAAYLVPVPSRAKHGSTSESSNHSTYQVPAPSKGSIKRHDSSPAFSALSTSTYQVPAPSRGSIKRYDSSSHGDGSPYPAPSNSAYQVPAASRGISRHGSIRESPTEPIPPMVPLRNARRQGSASSEDSTHCISPSGSIYQVPSAGRSMAGMNGTIRESSSSNSLHIVGSLFGTVRQPARMLQNLNQPFGVATNSKSQVIVADSGKHRVLVIDPAGDKITIGKEGIKKGQFKRPCGVAVDLDDNIYVVDSNNNRIQKFSPEGKFLAVGGSAGSGKLQFAYPIGICYNETNNQLYVCDHGNNRIQVLSTNLTFVRSFGELGSGNGQLNCPKHATFDEFDDLYVTDAGNNRVQVFTADGHFLRAFSEKTGGKSLEKPFAIAVDRNNTVYVSELNRHCVNQFTSDGYYGSSFGRKGSEEGMFSDIGSLCMLGNSLIVADTSNNRLQMF